MQLKFSAIEKASGGLTIPARGMGGDWILKLPSLRFDDIPENEFSIMSLAEKVGIEVPETRLVPMRQIEGLPPEAVNERMADENALCGFDDTTEPQRGGYTRRTSRRLSACGPTTNTGATPTPTSPGFWRHFPTSDPSASSRNG